MRKIWSIAKRELLSLWVTPLAWILLVSFLLIQGGVFYSITVHFSQLAEATDGTSPISAYFGRQSLLMALTLILLCPALSMRSLAEERRSGNMEALLAAPITSTAIVLGKYLAILATYVLIWLPTVLYALTLRDTGTLHPPTLVAAYLGILLSGAGYLAVGILTSALVKNQLSAHLLATGIIFGLFIVGVGEYIFEPGLLRDIGAYVSLTSLLEETSQGLIDSRRVVLYLSLTLWSLFVTARIVESWRDS